MAKIFVSYRRQDSPYVAAVLKDRLERRFGGDSVFFDIDNIPVGADFRKHIEAAVGQCVAMLVLIGDSWLAPVEGRKNRLFEPRDYVRMEIEAALGRKIPVVPVLVANADMPAAEDLPESIQELIFRNAAEVRAGRDLENHVARLIDSLWTLLESGATIARASRPRKSKKPQRTATPAAKTKDVRKKEQPALNKTILRRLFRDTDDTYVGSAIPPHKLHNALQSYAPDLDPSEVLAVHDNTVFGGASNGFLLTRTAIYWRNLGETPDSLEFHELVRVTHSAGSYEAVVRVNGRPIKLATTNMCYWDLASLLKGFITRRP
jgi:TIR domain